MKPHTIILLLLSLLLATVLNASSKEDKIQKNKRLNKVCFNCHNQKWYHYQNPETELEVKKRMFSELIIDSTEFYLSNHRTFKCISCHSDEYEEFPHPGELRMEEKYACNDCHGGDEDWAHFKFDEIEEQFWESSHSTSHDETFSCWMCHEPHSYHISARNEENLLDFIQYDNNICLNCHANADNYQRITDNINPNVIETHDWLPNQQLHFENVRCIECHTEISDNTLIAHKVLPKDEAVKNCVECHSGDSRLMESLYKHLAIESRAKAGFLNGVMLDQSFVIGANRNSILNKLSAWLFILVLGGITIHGLLRVILKKK
jgi:hypothetical protein